MFELERQLHLFNITDYKGFFARRLGIAGASYDLGVVLSLLLQLFPGWKPLRL